MYAPKLMRGRQVAQGGPLITVSSRVRIPPPQSVLDDRWQCDRLWRSNNIGCVMTTNYEVGQKDQRPWGTWEVIAAGPNYVVKQIVVKSGQRISMQRHQWRGERWTIVAGVGEVMRNGLGFRLVPGQ